jgi:hypothetical protein
MDCSLALPLPAENLFYSILILAYLILSNQNGVPLNPKDNQKDNKTKQNKTNKRNRNKRNNLD